MFSGPAKNAAPLSQRDKRLVALVAALHEKISRIDLTGLPKAKAHALEFTDRIATQLAKRLCNTKESFGESLELSRHALQKQLIPSLQSALESLQAPPPVAKAEQRSKPQEPQPLLTPSLNQNKAGWTGELLAGLKSMAEAAATLIIAPLLAASALLGRFVAKIKPSDAPHTQAPLAGASQGSRLLKRFNLPQFGWLQSLLTVLATPSMGKIKHGQTSAVRGFLPLAPSIAIGNELVPLQTWLSSNTAMVALGEMAKRLQDELFIECEAPLRKPKFDRASSAVQITISVRTGGNTLPLPPNHTIESIYFHSDPTSNGTATVIQSIFGGFTISIPLGVKKVTYIANPIDQLRTLSPQAEAALKALSTTSPNYDPIDRRYFNLLASSSATREARLQSYLHDLEYSRPRLYCDNAEILSSLSGTSSPFEMVYKSMIGVCLDFSRQAQADLSACGLPAVIVSANSIKGSKIGIADHAVVGTFVEKGVLVHDPTEDSWALKISATEGRRLAARLSQMPRANLDDIEALALVAYDELAKFAEFRQPLEDRRNLTSYGTEFTLAVRSAWSDFIKAEPEDAAPLFKALCKHLRKRP